MNVDGFNGNSIAQKIICCDAEEVGNVKNHLQRWCSASNFEIIDMGPL